nr:SHOCT domain-containing protein [uncultured Agathobaculum sp.]
MGLFDWTREDAPEQTPEENPLYQAQQAYEARRDAFERRKSIRLHDADGGAWGLAAEAGQLCLFPLLGRNATPKEALEAAHEILLAADAADVRKLEPDRTPIRTEGIFTVYHKPAVRLALTVPGRGQLTLTADRPDTAMPYLMEQGLARFRAVYDLLDCAGPVFDVRCRQGGELIPKGYTSMQVFRNADELIFVQSRRNIYGGGENTVAIGSLPAAAVRFYRLCGGVRTETRVSGGEVSIDRSAVLWSGWTHFFSLNPHADMMEDAISTRPVHTEQVEHDERYVELCVRMADKTYDLQFSPDSLAAFDAMVPEREFDEAALSDRQPTPAEQIAILARLCEQGWVTRAEFEQAKAKLLTQI